MKKQIKITNQIPLAPHEVEALKQDLDGLKKQVDPDTLGETDYSPANAQDALQDQNAIRHKIRMLEKQLDEGTKKVVDQSERARLEKRRKWLEDQFVDHLESHAELNIVSRNDPDFEGAVKKALKRKEVEHFIREWRNIGYRLEPDDPFYNDLGQLRKR